jgi:hypothetical protein
MSNIILLSASWQNTNVNHLKRNISQSTYKLNYFTIFPFSFPSSWYSSHHGCSHNKRVREWLLSLSHSVALTQLWSARFIKSASSLFSSSRCIVVNVHISVYHKNISCFINVEMFCFIPVYYPWQLKSVGGKHKGKGDCYLQHVDKNEITNILINGVTLLCARIHCFPFSE